MDAQSNLLDEVKNSGLPKGNFIGMIHVLIGRTITRKSDGVIVAKGLTWREVASLLKKVRWDPEAVRELGIDPDSLPMRDRQRYWYSAISLAKVESPAALKAGERFVDQLLELGFAVGPPPKS